MRNRDAKLNIVIIDSGFSSHIDIKTSFQGIHLKYYDGTITIEDNIDDTIGHGTAITFLIHKRMPNANIFCIKIYDDEFCRPELLIAALEYIYKNINCDIINISLGTLVCPNISLLKEICDKLSQKGVVIVSAFDNNGSISYPAAFDTVIGVDVSNETGNINEYDYIENSPVNILGYYREQRLPWLNNSYQIVSGASFIAPYTTVHIAELIVEGFHELEEIKEQLKIRANKIICYEKENNYTTFMPKKAITFPFNKEIHSLARYHDNLKFEIKDYFDVKYVGNIGNSVRTIIGGECHADLVIKNYTTINWDDDFDTLILGHTRELSNAVNFDFKKFFLDKALNHNKCVFSFDSVDEDTHRLYRQNNINLYFPAITTTDIPTNKLGKLRKIGKPILAVVGTGPRQGKFTLQISMKIILENSGYSVGMLGSEPSALLFGANQVYPMGYDSTVSIKGLDSIKVINNLMGKIEDCDPEIIIVGSQSQSVPFTDSSLKYLPVAQHEFILATVADCYVLCINLSDEIGYIHRTIKYLESIYGSKVIALAALPLDHANKWSIISNRKIKINEAEKRIKIALIEKQIELKIYDISIPMDIQNLTQYIVDYFYQN